MVKESQEDLGGALRMSPPHVCCVLPWPLCMLFETGTISVHPLGQVTNKTLRIHNPFGRTRDSSVSTHCPQTHLFGVSMPLGRSFPLNINSSLVSGVFFEVRSKPELKWDPQLTSQQLPAVEGNPEMCGEDQLYWW